jgi:hypothetical protein
VQSIKVGIANRAFFESLFAFTAEEIDFLGEQVSASPAGDDAIATMEFRFLNEVLIPFVVDALNQEPELAGPMAATLAQISDDAAFFEFVINFLQDDEVLSRDIGLLFFILQFYVDDMRFFFASLGDQLAHLLPRVDFDGVCIPAGLFLDFGEHAENVTVTGAEAIGTVAPIRREARA